MVQRYWKELVKKDKKNKIKNLPSPLHQVLFRTWTLYEIVVPKTA